MVEHSAVNRVVVGSSPTRGVGKSPQTSVFAFFLFGTKKSIIICASNYIDLKDIEKI